MENKKRKNIFYSAFRMPNEAHPIWKPSVLAWCLYDFANSAFPTIVTTFVFSTYYTQKVAQNPIAGTAEWGQAIALAGLVVALLSPVFGAIADKGGRQKPWLLFFTGVAIISSALLWYAKPMPSFMFWTLGWMFLGSIGFEFSMVFYNAMLREISPASHLGRISGLGWGLGYVGGILSLVFALVFFIKGNFSWLSLDRTLAEHIRISGPWVALWYFVFSIPLFLLTPDRTQNTLSFKETISQGMRELIRTLQNVWQYKQIVKFLVAHMIYSDGLTLIFTFGGIYAAGTLGMSFEEVLLFGITMNITACIGAIVFGWMDDQKGAKPTILMALLFMAILSSILLMLENKIAFWAIALVLGLFVGPAQAASRSLMARLSPQKLSTEMFGLYALSGKATAFLGPWFLGMITVYFNSQRMGMMLIILFLLVGALLLGGVRDPQKNGS